MCKMFKKQCTIYLDHLEAFLWQAFSPFNKGDFLIKCECQIVIPDNYCFYFLTISRMPCHTSRANFSFNLKVSFYQLKIFNK